ncbi:DinB family protein [Bacillus ndiopicus]|uniref:DinB family protein n=1 Tax=Bacillus ndiopicus TaxID=1347368 RepID=UPI00069442C8|nr:DinB family protein [Bacillus ndiopicus]
MDITYKSEAHRAILTMWGALRGRFTNMAKNLTEEQLDLKLYDTTIRSLLIHTAEAEYMFAEWYLSKEQPSTLPSSNTHEEIIKLLELSNTHVITAINELKEDELYTMVETKMGTSTPAEAVGRLMYHAGIHVGQIAFIKKQ